MKKEILKEIREPGKSRKRKVSRKDGGTAFGRSYRKGFTAAGLFSFFAFVPAVRPAIRRIRLLD